MKSILPKLARWFGFTVLISLTPLLVTGLGLRALSRPFGLKSIAGHGELLLISAAIGAAAIGELVPFKTKRWSAQKILVIAFTLVLVLISSMYFALIMVSGSATDPAVVSFDSLLLFIFTILLSGGCVGLSEV